MNILFVDDEPAILRTIKRTLRKLPDGYRIDLEADPAAALRLIAEKDYDLVVTDMRMPRINGHEVLAAAAKANPRCVRAVLSGYSAEADTAQAARYAHLFIGKPFAPKAILNLIERAEALGGMPLSDPLRRRLGALKALPPLPQLFASLTQALADAAHAPSLNEIAAIVARDISLSAKVMQLANSAFYSGSRTLNSVEPAVKRLGTRLLTGLVLQQEMFSRQPLPQTLEPWRDRLNRESLATASLSAAIARDQGLDAIACEEAGLAGMLRDIGRLMLVNEIDDPQMTLNMETRLHGSELCAEEEALLGAHHGWIGAYLLRLWEFPPAVVQAVAWHHHPSASGIPGMGILTALHAADALLSEQTRGSGFLDLPYLRSVGCADALPAWRERVLHRQD